MSNKNIPDYKSPIKRTQGVAPEYVYLLKDKTYKDIELMTEIMKMSGLLGLRRIKDILNQEYFNDAQEKK